MAHSAIKIFHVNISCGPPLKGNILGRNVGEMEFSLANLTTLQSHHSYLVQSDFSLKQFINNFLVLIPVISPQSSLPSASTILDTWDQPFLCEITFPFSFIKLYSPGFSLSPCVRWDVACISLPILTYRHSPLFSAVPHFFPYIFIHSVIFIVLSSTLLVSRDLPLYIMNRAWSIGSNSPGSICACAAQEEAQEFTHNFLGLLS